MYIPRLIHIINAQKTDVNLDTSPSSSSTSPSSSSSSSSSSPWSSSSSSASSSSPWSSSSAVENVVSCAWRANHPGYEIREWTICEGLALWKRPWWSNVTELYADDRLLLAQVAILVCYGGIVTRSDYLCHRSFEGFLRELDTLGQQWDFQGNLQVSAEEYMYAKKEKDAKLWQATRCLLRTGAGQGSTLLWELPTWQVNKAYSKSLQTFSKLNHPEAPHHLLETLQQSLSTSSEASSASSPSSLSSSSSSSSSSSASLSELPAWMSLNPFYAEDEVAPSLMMDMSTSSDMFCVGQDELGYIQTEVMIMSRGNAWGQWVLPIYLQNHWSARQGLYSAVKQANRLRVKRNAAALVQFHNPRELLRFEDAHLLSVQGSKVSMDLTFCPNTASIMSYLQGQRRRKDLRSPPSTATSPSSPSSPSSSSSPLISSPSSSVITRYDAQDVIDESLAHIEALVDEKLHRPAFVVTPVWWSLYRSTDLPLLGGELGSSAISRDYSPWHVHWMNRLQNLYPEGMSSIITIVAFLASILVTLLFFQVLQYQARWWPWKDWRPDTSRTKIGERLPEESSTTV